MNDFLKSPDGERIVLPRVGSPELARIANGLRWPSELSAAAECEALTAELNAIAKGLPYSAVELLRMALGQIGIGLRLRNTQRDYLLSAMRYVVVEPINGGTDWYNLAAFTGKHVANEWAKANTPENLHGDYPLEVRELGTEYTS